MQAIVPEAATVSVGENHMLFGAVTDPVIVKECGADQVLLPNATIDPATVINCADHVLPGAVTEDPADTVSVEMASVAEVPASTVQPLSVRMVAATITEAGKPSDVVDWTTAL